MGSPAVYRTLLKEIKPLYVPFPLTRKREKERKADPHAPWFVPDLGLSINTLLFGVENIIKFSPSCTKAFTQSQQLRRHRALKPRLGGEAAQDAKLLRKK